MITDRSEVTNTALVGVDAFAGALTRGSIGTIPETAETENTRSYQGGLWLGTERFELLNPETRDKRRAIGA
jgi:hypothetical protein